MDATLTSLEGKAAELTAGAREKADHVLADLHKTRDDFRDAVNKQAEANEATWKSVKAQLESDWTAFQAEVNKNIDSFGKQIEQQQAIFQRQADAQLKAWRDAADQLGAAAKGRAPENRGLSLAERRARIGELDRGPRRARAKARPE